MGYRQIGHPPAHLKSHAQTTKRLLPEGPQRRNPKTKLTANSRLHELRFDLYEASIIGLPYTNVGLHIQSSRRDMTWFNTT